MLIVAGAYEPSNVNVTRYYTALSLAASNKERELWNDCAGVVELIMNKFGRGQALTQVGVAVGAESQTALMLAAEAGNFIVARKIVDMYFRGHSTTGA